MWHKYLLHYLEQIPNLWNNQTSNFDQDDQYMKTYFRIINKEKKKLSQGIDQEQFMKTLLNIEVDNVTDNTGISLYVELLLVTLDLYLLLRLFIQFDLSKMSRGPTHCRSDTYSVPRNVIACTGGHHSLIFIKFFKQFFHQADPKVMSIIFQKH